MTVPKQLCVPPHSTGPPTSGVLQRGLYIYILWSAYYNTKTTTTVIVVVEVVSKPYEYDASFSLYYCCCISAIVGPIRTRLEVVVVVDRSESAWGAESSIIQAIIHKVLPFSDERDRYSKVVVVVL